MGMCSVPWWSKVREIFGYYDVEKIEAFIISRKKEH